MSKREFRCDTCPKVFDTGVALMVHCDEEGHYGQFTISDYERGFEDCREQAAKEFRKSENWHDPERFYDILRALRPEGKQ